MASVVKFPKYVDSFPTDPGSPGLVLMMYPCVLKYFCSVLTPSDSCPRRSPGGIEDEVLGDGVGVLNEGVVTTCVVFPLITPRVSVPKYPTAGEMLLSF